MPGDLLGLFTTIIRGELFGFPFPVTTPPPLDGASVDIVLPAVLEILGRLTEIVVLIGGEVTFVTVDVARCAGGLLLEVDSLGFGLSLFG